MNIKQLMLIMASFSLMPLGAAEQMPEASSSTETTIPQPVTGKESLEYGTCTLEDRATSGYSYQQPQTENFAKMQTLNGKNSNITAVTLFEGFTRNTSAYCKTGHDMRSPLCKGYESSNYMRCGGYIANALDESYIKKANEYTQSIMNNDTHESAAFLSHRFITHDNELLKKHAQHGGAHGIVALIDTEKDILFPVNLGLRLMVIRNNKLLYVTEDQTILQRYANILFTKNKSAFNALKTRGFLKTYQEKELNYTSVTIGDKQSERFTFGPHGQSSEFTTCIGDTVAHKHGADFQPNFNVYKNTEATLELCDNPRIKLENNDLIVMATNNFFGILKDTQEVLDEFGHIKQDLTEAHPIALLITSKLSTEPTIDLNDLAYYLTQEARTAGEPRSITVQVIRYKKTVTNPAINGTTAQAASEPKPTPAVIVTDATPVLKIKPAMSAPAASDTLTPERPIVLVGNSDGNDADDEEEIEEAVTVNSIGDFDYSYATLDNSRPGSGYTNQDCAHEEKINDSLHFIGVFDGHGADNAPDQNPDGTLKSGGVIARWAARAYPLTLKKQQISKQCAFNDEDLHNIVAKNMQRFLTEKTLKDISKNSGTTACMALIDKAAHQLISINIGDSRLIVIRNNKCVFSTEDQTVENEFDAATIGKIKNPNNPLFKGNPCMQICTIRDGITGLNNIFIYHKQSPISTNGVMRLGGLAMTRSLGDTSSHEQGVTHNPEVETFDLEDGDIIVNATDGLWGNKNNELVTLFITKTLQNNRQADLSEIAQNLAKAARGNDKNGAQQDDITIQIVRYKKLPIPTPAQNDAPVATAQETTQPIVQQVQETDNTPNDAVVQDPEIINPLNTVIATNIQPDQAVQTGHVAAAQNQDKNAGYPQIDQTRANPDPTRRDDAADDTHVFNPQTPTVEEKPWLRIAADKANEAATQVAQFVQEHPKLAAAATIGAGLTYYWAKVYNKKK